MDDFGFTDLGIMAGSFVEHGAQEIPPEEEVAQVDAHGNVIQEVAVKHSHGLRYAGDRPLKDDHMPCEYAVPVVGKVRFPCDPPFFQVIPFFLY